MNTFINNEEFNKKKVIFIMGATGTGKSRLSVDVAGALHSPNGIFLNAKVPYGQIQRLISEKMLSVHHIIATDIFKEDKEEYIDEAWTNTVLQPCLDIVKKFVKSDHHNIIIECEIEPDLDFTAEDFCLQAVKTQRVPIIVGGSNSYIEKLGEDVVFMFKYKYDSCFIWIDVEQSILNHRVDMRVDQMVKAVFFVNILCINQDILSLDHEVRQIFNLDADYTKGIRQSIGVSEMDKYLREKTNIDGDDESKQMILQSSISSIKRNTRMLIFNQLDKIDGLISEKIRFQRSREEDLHEAWTITVLQLCLDIVKRFLKNDHHNIIIECT
uniref:Isopentenyltransferase n=1 Tax=Solanum lycopersicum TaxID=4081 RepID=A0A3Q7JKH4_SOLLC